MLNLFKKKPALPDSPMAWNDEHTNFAAANVRDMLYGFKYIIEVDRDKIYQVHAKKFFDPIYWGCTDEFQNEYCYPARKVGEHVIIKQLCGNYTYDHRIFVRANSGLNVTFVGTNVKDDAIMIALKYK